MAEYMTYEQYLVDVKKGILTDRGACPVTPLLLKLQGRWKSQILYELIINDPARFGQIRNDLPGITNTVLTKALRELEEDGLVHRVSSVPAQRSPEAGACLARTEGGFVYARSACSPGTE